MSEIQFAPLVPIDGTNGIHIRQFDRQRALSAARDTAFVEGAPATTKFRTVDPTMRLATNTKGRRSHRIATNWMAAQAKMLIGNYAGNYSDAQANLLQITRYNNGGHIIDHADNSLYDINTDEETVMYPDRQLTALMYLNDQGAEDDLDNLVFTGSDLKFLVTPRSVVKEEMIVRPEAGKTLFFPSDARYFHRGMPLTGNVPKCFIVMFFKFI